MVAKTPTSEADRFVSRDGEFTITLSPEQQARRQDVQARGRRGGRRQRRVQVNVAPLLAELRVSEGRTQQELASALGVTRPTIARLEKQDDLMLSSLCSYMQHLGGHVELVINDHRIPINAAPAADPAAED